MPDEKQIKTIALSEWQFFLYGGKINSIGTRKPNRNNIKVRAGESRRLLFLFRKWKSLVSCMSPIPPRPRPTGPASGGNQSQGSITALRAVINRFKTPRVRFHLGYFCAEPTYELLKPARLSQHSNQRILLGVIYPLEAPGQID